MFPFANSSRQFDVAIGKPPARRIVFKLYDDTVPKTAENFRKLAVGVPKKELASLAPQLFSSRPGEDETKLGYTGSIFHRIIPQASYSLCDLQLA